ncbi:hypothetical protein [uncultured Roseibium sp.]|nr:hypothetical protein [uncultured Roseibium sp.]
MNRSRFVNFITETAGYWFPDLRFAASGMTTLTNIDDPVLWPMV